MKDAPITQNSELRTQNCNLEGVRMRRFSKKSYAAVSDINMTPLLDLAVVVMMKITSNTHARSSNGVMLISDTAA